MKAGIGLTLGLLVCLLSACKTQMSYVIIPDLGRISTGNDPEKSEAILVQRYQDDAGHNRQLDEHADELAAENAKQYPRYEVLFMRETAMINQQSIARYHGLDVPFIEALNASLFKKYKYEKGRLVSVSHLKNGKTIHEQKFNN